MEISNGEFELDDAFKNGVEEAIRQVCKDNKLPEPSIKLEEGDDGDVLFIVDLDPSIPRILFFIEPDGSIARFNISDKGVSTVCGKEPTLEDPFTTDDMSDYLKYLQLGQKMAERIQSDCQVGMEVLQFEDDPEYQWIQSYESKVNVRDIEKIRRAVDAIVTCIKERDGVIK